MSHRHRSLASMLAAFAGLAAAPAFAAQIQGPSSSATPYLLPAPGAPAGINVVSIVTVTDTVAHSSGVGTYRMVGIPDGLGAFDNGDGSFTLMMNHELGNTSGAIRAHGQRGSFVSRWNISKATLGVNSARDHNTAVADAYEYSSGTGTWSNAASSAQNWGRYCSGDLAEASAYKFGALGTDARIMMNGEEVGNEGRAYAHIATGTGINQTWQLPHMGKFSWENSVANPYAQEKTLVLGTDDTTPGQLYLYIGTKTSTGNDIERAGLTNGTVHGVKVSGIALEDRAAGIASGTVFTLASLGSVANTSGGTLQTTSVSNGVTEFLRPEDGAWDPRDPSKFYFVTTDRYNNAGDGTGSQVGRSRLYRLNFTDITNPAAGGTIDMLLDGTEGQQMMDNICVDRRGNVVITEDVGNNQRAGIIWNYKISTDVLSPLLIHDAARFGNYSPATTPFNQDEEASGIIDASDIIGPGWYLFDDQTHYGVAGEFVEGGQLLALYVPPVCAGDLNNDGFVNVQDLTIFLGRFGNAGLPGATGDLNNDGAVNVADLTIFLGDFGLPC